MSKICTERISSFDLLAHPFDLPSREIRQHIDTHSKAHSDHRDCWQIYLISRTVFDVLCVRFASFQFMSTN